MNDFAHGFSETLKSEATKHRPEQSSLSLAQIGHLCNLAGYEIEITTSRFDPSEFTIHRPNGEINPGLEDGLDIIWYVRAVGTCVLVYFPTLKPKQVYGHNPEVIDEILLRLASFLPNLGYQSEYIAHLEEEFIIIPDELRYLLSTGINVIYATEFQKKYKPLYLYLKEKMVTPR